MRRVIFSVLSTTLAIVALLSFKSHVHVAIVSALPSAGLGNSSTAAATPGTAAQTPYETVQVAVTVAGTKITNVSFLRLTSNDGRSASINSQAGPLVLQETLSAQSSHIDSISGATYTRQGYLQSLQSALDQAGIK